ncbi:signal transduction histidine kinase [Pedobacter sp. CG_S7]|uniref:hypothetical protein n=1 Tax=Pedobacter sp. CG_S7 TaxID=3143930 RepID=UPI003396C26D
MKLNPFYCILNALKQIINLISNVIKYAPGETTINVACTTIGNFFQVSVQNQGFDRFYRVDNEQAQNISGFGMGSI